MNKRDNQILEQSGDNRPTHAACLFFHCEIIKYVFQVIGGKTCIAASR